MRVAAGGPTYTRLFLLAAVAVAAGSLAALVAPAPADAAVKPCWKRLINDWYDGRIDNAYPIECYRDAIKNLPEDVRAYSTARDDINRALLAAIRKNGAAKPKEDEVVKPPPASPPSKGDSGSTGSGDGGSDSGSEGSGSSGSGSGGSAGSGGSGSSGSGSGSDPSGGTGGSGDGGSSTTPTGTTKLPPEGGQAAGREPKGPIGDLLDEIGPKNADSVPVPLIVLAGIATLLLAAAAAGFVARRVQSRRVRITPDPPEGSESP
jgi:hypothetical protein